MVANLQIKDGNPIWLSNSIIPSKDTVVSPNSSPTIATIKVDSNDVYVYVKVDNIGTIDLGQCNCSKKGQWAGVLLFPNFIQDTNANKSYTQYGVTFKLSNYGDSLSGSGFNYNFGLSASGKRAWAWSPDGRYFAYVSSFNDMNWTLTVVALQDVTKSDSSVIQKGQMAGTTNGLYPWNNINFGWAGSRAISATGKYSGFVLRSLLCPEASGQNCWSDPIADNPGKIDWTHLISPCESVVAYVPKILNANVGSRDVILVSTTTAKTVQFRKNNVPTTVSITGNSPSITTNQHAANGVEVKTGSNTVTVDDPDCTLVGGSIIVRVDRVKASTLPSANLGVMPIGNAVIDSLPVNGSRWVKVPNQNGWANQGESHWCLLAQTYTSDGTTIPCPWNGQATNPQVFPITKENCAQRNIAILP